MDSWSDIRRKARACHRKALVRTGDDRRADKIVAAALNEDDLELSHYKQSDVPGVFGFLDRGSRLVNVAKDQDPLDELVVIAHEIGHFNLHRDARSEVTIRPGGLGGDPSESGAGRVEGYSPRERREIQADIFAGELLCPSDWLRERYVTGGAGAEDVAKELGLPCALVRAQLIRALLLPPLVDRVADEPAMDHVLDGTQSAAATWAGGPLMVDAGPGTGKTRTLIHRVKHLLKPEGRPGDGISPADILALTFSNKAAEEMRDRLSIADPDAAVELWAGTFHAFGQELVRKWPTSVRRKADVRTLDEAGQLALLEDNLEKLPLRHYQNLYEPAYELVPVLRAISRCKDELVGPAEYRRAAEAARAAAATGTDEEKEAADKAVEIADIYDVYEAELERANAVDFGDLIRLATELIKGNAAVGAYIAGFKHVLVDEYQDVNFASSQLLQAIFRMGPVPWVVADQRQSIYRFRGAEPSNVSRFAEEFGGEIRSLGVNYRSFAPVVRTFERFSSAMGDGAIRGRWEAQRGEGGTVGLTVAPTVAAEAEAIKERIEAFVARGVQLGDQAVLARSHLTLARITTVLEKLGVPLLYLGDLFERSEIRDLLSLIALDAEWGNVGLVRVGAFPEYDVPRSDSLAVAIWARDQKIPLVEALERASDAGPISEQGRAGLAKLASHLKGLENVSPWIFLTTYLFERSAYLKPLLAAGNAISQQKLVAIYHLLKACGDQGALSDYSRRSFLSRVRRIEQLNQDSTYRAVASEASDMDAVRVSTIHGSKGLEFGAVHVPALATRYMPSNRQWDRCPPPPLLARLAMTPEDHEAEEECLFFVALSRARDFLSLSRAERYTSTNATASKFIPKIAASVAPATYRGSGCSYDVTPELRPPAPRQRYSERELSVYMQCPARYRYEAVEGLYGAQDQSAYVRFHRCVYVTVGWLEEQRAAGKPTDAAAALGRLDAEWRENGPKHPLEPYYRAEANRMVETIAAAIAAEAVVYAREEWVVPVARGKEIAVTPDRVLVSPDGGVCVQRVRTGRRTKSEADNGVYAVLRRGAARSYPGRAVTVETFYLATRERIPVVARNDDKAIEKYSDAIAAIEAGDFHAAPDQRRCPSCQCYFICGA